MLIELDIFNDGEEITFAEVMIRIEPSYQLLLKQSKGIYRWFRFNSLIRGNADKEILFQKSDGSTETRYAIIKEDKDNYYIAINSNNITCDKSVGIAKDMYSKFARITEEKFGNK